MKKMLWITILLFAVALASTFRVVWSDQFSPEQRSIALGSKDSPEGHLPNVRTILPYNGNAYGFKMSKRPRASEDDDSGLAGQSGSDQDFSDAVEQGTSFKDRAGGIFDNVVDLIESGADKGLSVSKDALDQVFSAF